LRGRIEHAQSLIAGSEFDEAIKFLEEALSENNDAALRLLLEKAVAGKESLRVQIEEVLTSASGLVLAGKHTEAIEFLHGQPPAVKRSASIRAAEFVIKDEQQQSVYRTIGRAYASLASDMPQSAYLMRRTKAALANSPEASGLMDQFQARMRKFADQGIEELIAASKTMIRNRDKAAAADAMDRGAKLVEYAGPKTQSNWKSLMSQAAKAGLPVKSQTS
jgi:hypothetical protein